MLHTLIKLKLFKLSLLSALSAGIVIALIAKDIRDNKKTDEAVSFVIIPKMGRSTTTHFPTKNKQNTKL